MDRITDIDESRITAHRAALQNFLPDCEKPLPGSRLMVDDDITYLEIFPMRVLWGHDHPQYFNAYGNDFGDTIMNLDGAYITDRAPADPQDAPAMPVYPVAQQQQQQQPPKHGRKRSLTEEQRALQAVLAQIPIPDRQKVIKRVRETRPELLKNA